jgi:hypothetical protein
MAGVPAQPGSWAAPATQSRYRTWRGGRKCRVRSSGADLAGPVTSQSVCTPTRVKRLGGEWARSCAAEREGASSPRFDRREDRLEDHDRSEDVVVDSVP